MSTVTTVPAEAKELREGISLLEAAQSNTLTRPDGTSIELGYDGSGNKKDGGVFDAKGRVPLHIIRPGIGKGRGRHLYEANMLKENASVFSGWRMMLNHQSPEAKKAAGGLPRDVRDLGGLVKESWFDDSIPADDAKEHGAGGVVGMVRPVKAIRELIDDDPELIEASISASATAVRPVTHGGQRCWLVEGINPRGTVDWVTEAGAGGRIAPLLQEAYADEEDVQVAILESMSDEEIRRALTEARPELLAEAKTQEIEDPTKTGPKAEDLRETTNSSEGDDVAEITPEALQEALKATPTLLVEAAVQSGEFQVFLSSLVEAKVEEERETLRAESKADVDRAFQLAGMEREAHKRIDESKLPESWRAGLKEKFSLVENSPTDALDVVDEIDDDGKVKTPALARLRESVDAEIVKERERLREASPTRIRAPHVVQESKTDDKDEDQDKDKGPLPYWAQTLSEAGVLDPTKAYEPLQGA